ncbi:hypothetical protein [Desulfobulbus propionicus]|jgi:hypothetical protein
MAHGRFCWWAAALCFLVLAGCAGKLPQTRSIPESEVQQAQRVWDDFLRHEQPTAIDADFRLRWDVLGSKGGIDGVLQMKQPALLRFAANDPLGRSLILAVSDGQTFTFVDNREGRAYRGKTDAAFWRRYVPKSVQAADLFYYLGGGVDPNQVPRVQSSVDATSRGYWYKWRDNQAIGHHVLLDNRTGMMQRHLLIDRSGKQVLDLQYRGSVGTVNSVAGEAKQLSWPQVVIISGEAVSGEVEVRAEKIYGFAIRGAALFRLTPPPHFSLEEVD